MGPIVRSTGFALAFVLGMAAAWAKLPPPAPLDEKGKAAAEEKKAKDAVAAEKAKAELTASMDKAVKNRDANLKKAGKPVPKPTPIVAAAAPTPAAAPAAPAKPGEKAKAPDKK